MKRENGKVLHESCTHPHQLRKKVHFYLNNLGKLLISKIKGVIIWLSSIFNTKMGDMYTLVRPDKIN